MVTVLVGSKGRIDFATPVDSKHKEDLVELLTEIFCEEVVEVEPTDQHRDSSHRVGEQKSFPREWSLPEEKMLANYYRDEDEIAKRIGRSRMSVKNKRPDFIGGFRAWLSRTGQELPDDVADIHDLVEEYVKQMRLYKEEQKEMESEKREVKKSLQEIDEAIENKKEELDGGVTETLERGLTNHIEDLKEKRKIKEGRLQEIEQRLKELDRKII